MNLQHERMQMLCELLNLPFVAQAYPVAAQDATQQETPYSDFLEGLLRAETAGRNVRKQNMLTRLSLLCARFWISLNQLPANKIPNLQLTD